MSFGGRERTTLGGALWRQRASRIFLRAAAIALGLSLLPVMLDYLGRQMLYPAPAVPVPSPPPTPLREVALGMPGGEALCAWWRPGAAAAAEAPMGGTPAVLFFHGNGENLETLRWAGLYDRLAGLGVHSLAVDYPGYGRSGGSPSEASLAAAGEAGFEWLRRRHPGSPTVVLGWSLGAAVAVKVAAHHPRETAGLVLLSAWDDPESLGSVHFPRWLVGIALADRWDSRARAAEIGAPVLMIHGAADRVIPLDHGRRLQQAFAGGARFVAVPGAGHNDLLGREVVWEALGAFFREIAEARASDKEAGSE